MSRIYDLLPDAETLLALEPEELAGVLLEHLHTAGNCDCNRYNFSLGHETDDYPPEHHDAIKEAFMAAWVWLEREGLLIPKPGDSAGSWSRISPRGRRLATAQDVEAYRRASQLPRGLLHPLIAQRVSAEFLRGDYDAAVFLAFKAVEMHARESGGYDAKDRGTGLMRKAFSPIDGRLTDKSGDPGEQQAHGDLFAGAIGCYKNPSSHRHVNFETAEAIELLILASHLLRVVDDARESSGDV